MRSPNRIAWNHRPATHPTRHQRPSIELLEQRLLLAGDGLQATYYDNRDFTGATVSRVDPAINFNWGTGSPATGIAPNTFSTRWTGQIEAPTTETYTFYARSDDGVRLWVNGVQIINSWRSMNGRESVGRIALQAGQRYDIRLDYYEYNGSALAQLRWSTPTISKRLVPQAQLYSTTPPAPATNLQASPTGSVVLTWTDNATNEQGWLIERSTDGVNFIETGRVGANETSYVDSSTTEATAYTYSIRSYNGAGLSAAALVSVVVPPLAPTSLSAVATATNQVRLNWTDLSLSESGYAVARSSDGGVSFAPLVSLPPNSTQYFDETANPGATLTYRVNATSILGPSAGVDAVVTTGQTPAAGVNVKDFGAVGDGVADDTAAIQRAIDSLAVAHSVLLVTQPQGGVVQLPEGVYRTTAPLLLKTGISLHGHTPNTTIRNESSDATQGAVELVPADSANAYITAAEVKNLTIQTAHSYGIRARGWARMVVLQCRFEDITISAGNWGIYLPGTDAYTQNTWFNNVRMYDVGAGLVWVDGNANHLEAIRSGGTARAQFAASPAMLRVGGSGNVISGCVVGGAPAGLPVTAYYLSGYDLLMADNWHSIHEASNGVVYHFEQLRGLSVKDLNGLDATHRAQFAATTGANIAKVSLATGATLEQSFQLDSASAVRVDSVDLVGSAPVSQLGTSEGYSGVDARSFGVIGDGVADDTAALQRAISSLAVGDTLYLPRGQYRTLAPLVVPNGISIVGEGTGSVIANSGADAQRAAFELIGGNLGTSIRNLTIVTDKAQGIRAADGAGVIQNLRLKDLVISAGNWGVVFRAGQGTLESSRLKNIHMRNIGAGAAWVEGNGNLIEGVNTEAGVRTGFAVDLALLRVAGNDNTLRSCILEGIPTGYSTISYYVSGQRVRWENNWEEVNTHPDNIAYWFDNVSGLDGDHLWHLLPTHAARVTNSAGIRFDSLDISPTQCDLRDVFKLDSTSTVAIGDVAAMFDPGYLDDPQISIGGFWNSRMGTYVDVQTLMELPNLLPNGNFTNGMDGWYVSWGQGVVGTATVENAPEGGTRLKITITSNPNNAKTKVWTRVTVPTELSGHAAYVAYRLDWSTGMFIEPYFNGSTLHTRAKASLTAAKLPSLVTDQQIPYLVSGSAGTAYFSNVKVALLPTDPQVF